MQPSRIQSEQAPKAIGPYSQAIVVGDFVFCSGQIGLDPASGQVVEGHVQAQTRRALENLKAVLEAAGSDLSLVVKTTVFLVDMSDFQAMNEAYGAYFGDQPPARSTVAVKQLPRPAALVEIEAVAVRKA